MSPYRRKRIEAPLARRSPSTAHSRSLSRTPPRRKARSHSRTPPYRGSPSQMSMTPIRNGKKRARSPEMYRPYSRSLSPPPRGKGRAYFESRSTSPSRSITPPRRRGRDEMSISPPPKRRRRSPSRDRYRETRRRSPPRRSSPSIAPSRSRSPPAPRPKEPSGTGGTSIKGAASRRREADAKMISTSPIRARSRTPERSPIQSRSLIDRLGGSKWARNPNDEDEKEKSRAEMDRLENELKERMLRQKVINTMKRNSEYSGQLELGPN
ncbi:uncharacterized protein EI90DRAFT_3030498 [Cantharellus anzutake]|uniref:uncharacterized protein n=1 Tax=Cantharellus anzutake TaxID=1750568 RepID=UPI001907163C|nr:uncharacterized protein EI90DRAFT_3030498 [Cantharellus anzutake]KAF8342865.1 hypothetical protein EI90DRAFT_3030498 [Cantharellus anzutake]